MSLSKILFMAVLLVATAISASTWYSVGDGSFFNGNSFNSQRDGNGEDPADSRFLQNDTWVIQDGHSLTHHPLEIGDYLYARRVGSGTKIIVEEGGTLTLNHHLTSTGGAKFGSIEVYGEVFHPDRLVAFTDLKIYDGGFFQLESDSLSITNFYIYGGGEYEHYRLNPVIPGTNRYFANSTNGGNGNGKVTIKAQDGALSNGITWGNVELNVWESGAEDMINDGAFADVQGDFTVKGTDGEYYYLIGTGTTNHTIKGKLIIDGGNLVLRVSDGTGAVYFTVEGNLELKSGRLIQSAEAGGTVLTVQGDFKQTGGYYWGSWHPAAVNQLKLWGALNVAATGTSFKAYEDVYASAEAGGGYLDIIFAAAALPTAHDLRLPTGLNCEEARWNISIKEKRVITLTSNIEIGTTNYSTYAPHLQFTVGGEGELKFGNYVVKNAVGTFDEGYEPEFYLNSLGILYVTTAQGLALTGDTGPVRVTGTRYYDNGATVYYTGTSAQFTGDGIDGLQYLEIDNAAGVKLSADLTVVDVTIKNGKLDPNGYQLTITGTLSTSANGSLESGDGITINGYDGWGMNGDEYFTISENEYSISDFSLSTNAYGTYFPERIDRSWIINGTLSGPKSFTFSWTEDDDNNYSWPTGWGATIYPVLYQGSTLVTLWGWPTGQRSLTEYISELEGAKGVFTIGRSDGEPFEGDPPLPVELSSFTATLSADSYVSLSWVTQSETGVNGYYVFRNTETDLPSAQLISPLIPAQNASQQQSYSYLDSELYDSGTYYYWLQSSDFNGSMQFFGPVSVLFTPGDDSGTPQIPAVTSLQAVYPNPFNPIAYIPFSLAQDSEVTVSILNSRGQLVRDFTLGQKEAGMHRIEWNGKDYRGLDCGSGVYSIILHADRQLFQRKAVLMK